MAFFGMMVTNYIPKAKSQDVMYMDGVGMIREESSLFVLFTERNEKDIKGKKLNLSLNMKARNQIYKLIEKYSTVYRETDETGWQYDITTSECVFRDMSQFYRPKCFDAKNNYIETSSMEEFILHNYPSYVLMPLSYMRSIIPIVIMLPR